MVETTPESSVAPRKIAWHCACFNLRRAARALSRFYDAALAPSGLRNNQFSMLGAINMIGPMSQADLADRLDLDRTTLTRNLKTAGKEGFIAMSAGRDRRERIVALTPLGEAALARALPLWRDAQARAMSRLGAERWREMIADLDEMTRIDNSGQ